MIMNGRKCMKQKCLKLKYVVLKECLLVLIERKDHLNVNSK